MKKKYLSALVIIATAIFVYLMLSYNNTVYEEEYKMVQKNEKNYNKEELFNQILRSEKDYEKNEMKNSDENREEKAESYIEPENKNIEKIEQIEKNNEKEVEIIENKSTESKVNEVKKEELFKIKKEDILSNLTKEDKKVLRTTIKKLSISDYVTIVNSIKNNGELECCLKVTTILKERLNEEDYEKTKTVLGEYININILEKKLNF
ncbi:MAG: hypothetical protein ACRDD2_11950 [Sarcina sp.]